MFYLLNFICDHLQFILMVMVLFMCSMMFLIKSSDINNYKIKTDRFNVDFILNGDYVISQVTNGQYMSSCTATFNTSPINFCNYILDELKFDKQNAIIYATDNCINGISMFGYTDPDRYQCIQSLDIYPFFDRERQSLEYSIFIFLTVFLILSLLALFLNTRTRTSMREYIPIPRNELPMTTYNSINS